MYVFWEGYGGAVIGFYILGIGSDYLIGRPFGVWVGTGLAGAVTWLLGWAVNVHGLSRDSGDRDQHTLYGLPMQYWGIFGVAAMVWDLLCRALSS